MKEKLCVTHMPNKIMTMVWIGNLSVFLSTYDFQQQYTKTKYIRFCGE